MMSLIAPLNAVMYESGVSKFIQAVDRCYTTSLHASAFCNPQNSAATKVKDFTRSANTTGDLL